MTLAWAEQADQIHQNMWKWTTSNSKYVFHSDNLWPVSNILGLIPASAEHAAQIQQIFNVDQIKFKVIHFDVFGFVSSLLWILLAWAEQAGPAGTK